MPATRDEALIECCCQCSRYVCGTLDFALKQGWRNLAVSSKAPEGNHRTHLGFCPACARQYGATSTDLPERRHTV